jgi:hypothetical protein
VLIFFNEKVILSAITTGICSLWGEDFLDFLDFQFLTTEFGLGKEV